MVVTIQNSEHYVWGGIWDGWHLLQRGDMSVIQERVPAGGAEVMHHHNTAMCISSSSPSLPPQATV